MLRHSLTYMLGPLYNMMDILAVSVLSFVSLLLVLLLMISYKRTSLSPKNAAVAIPSPRTTLLPSLSLDAISQLPYPPNLLPGARDIVTPHGTMRVYEYGPEDGPKVLLIHGDTTPAPMLGPIAHELVRRGCRVLMFGTFSKNGGLDWVLCEDSEIGKLSYCLCLYCSTSTNILRSMG